MQFLLLIYEAESVYAARTEADSAALLADYMAFGAAIRQGGKFIAGEALRPIETATTVRVRDGETMVTDGPFAETREQLGGFYLVEATDLDDAIAIAARIPSAKSGSIEVRPIWTYTG
ncbi:MAG: YciI family protein [Deltaproteobacteria bacterium]|nr:YciI family protein [Nannocystaceae bacterium]